MEFITRRDRNIADGFPPDAGLTPEDPPEDYEDEGYYLSNRAIVIRLPADDEPD